MGNPLRKSPINRFRRITLAVVCAVILLSLGGSIWLSRSRARVEERLSERIPGLRVRARIFFYVFPHFLVAWDLDLLRTDPADPQPVMSVPVAILRCALGDIRQPHWLTIPGMSLRHAQINTKQLAQYLAPGLTPDDPGGAAHRPIPRREICFQQARLLQPDQPAGPARLDGCLRVGEGQFSAEGRYAVGRRLGLSRLIRRRRLPQDEVSIKVGGMFAPGRVTLDPLDLRVGSFATQLRGHLNDGSVDLQGYAILSSDVSSPAPRPSRRQSSAVNGAVPGGLVFMDITAQAQIEYPLVQLANLTCQVNHRPLTVSGNLLLGSEPTLQITALLAPGKSAAPRFGKVQEVKLDVMTEFTKDTPLSQGAVSCRFADNERGAPMIPRLDLTFTGLKMRLRQGLVRAQAQSGQLSYWLGTTRADVPFTGLSAVFNRQLSDYDLVRLSAPMTTGKMLLNAWLGKAPGGAGRFFDLDIQDAEMDGLTPVGVLPFTLTGRLFAEVFLEQAGGVTAAGQLDIRDGVLSRFGLFDWFADRFALPQMRQIPFSHLTSQLTINAQGVSLGEVFFDSTPLKISGFFDLKNQNLVNSHLNLQVDPGVFAGSPRLAPLFADSERYPAGVDFPFRLSGQLMAMNFQWMPSPAKSLIQDRMPNFIERRIDRNVEQLLDASAGGR